MIVAEISSIDFVVELSQRMPSRAISSGVGDFLTAVLDAGVAAVRTALVANFGKALGLDGEAEELFAKRNEASGRGAAVEVLGG